MRRGALLAMSVAIMAALTSAAAPAQSSCADLGGTAGPDRACHVRTSTAAYDVDISFPLDYPDLQAVTGFVKRGRDEFTGWVARFGPGAARGRPYQYAVTGETYRSGTPSSGTESLVLTVDNDTGLANEGHPNTTFQAFDYDLAKRTPITFGTLFKPGTTPLGVLNPIVRRALDAPSAELTENTYQNFAITDDAVIFFFGQNQIVPDNNGPHQVSVPRADLASMLAYA